MHRQEYWFRCLALLSGCRVAPWTTLLDRLRGNAIHHATGQHMRNLPITIGKLQGGELPS